MGVLRVGGWGVGETRRALGVGAERICEQMNRSDLQSNIVASSSAVVGRRSRSELMVGGEVIEAVAVVKRYKSNKAKPPRENGRV